jgi:hypothetical protein
MPKLNSLPKVVAGPLDRFRSALQPCDANQATRPAKRPAEDPDPAAEPPAKRAKPSSASATPATPPPQDLESFLTGLAKSLHDANPDHPIFGEPLNGIIRLPYKAERKNGQCWHNIMRKIANWVVDEMGDNWAMENCWMSNKGQIQITQASGAHSNTVFASITVIRLIHFFANPSDARWKALSEQDKAESTPFDHRCARGHTRYDGQVGCLNGVFHGSFTSKKANESRKTCKNGALCLCPGHGEGGECIYTREDGTLAECRMKEDHVPKCACEKACF